MCLDSARSGAEYLVIRPRVTIEFDQLIRADAVATHELGVDAQRQRLCRRRTRAQVICYDKRLSEQAYGRRMLQGLPPYRFLQRK